MYFFSNLINKPHVIWRLLPIQSSTMSEERPETQSRSSTYLSVTHETATPSVSLSEGQKMLLHMDNVFHKIAKAHPDVKIMIVAKTQRYLKTNYLQGRGLQSSSCILNFTDLVHVLMRKMFPDEPVENVRIKGRHDEIFVSFDNQLEIIVIEKERHKTGI